MLSIITGLGGSRNLCVWALVASAAAFAGSCNKVPLLAPRESTITLSTASTVVQANGTTEIRATVLEPSGTPVQNGTTVTFTTNLGTLSPTEARTFNGVATVQFLGNGQSGKASIIAISGGAASTALDISVGAGAVGRVVVTASPNQVAPGSPSIITATVTDTNGNPLRGVSVSFSTDNGSLSATSATTSISGQAQVALSTTRDATVTATAGAATPGTTKVTVGSQPDLMITSSTATPTQGNPVTFNVTVTQGSATETFQSLVVDFGDGSTSGPLSGTTQSVSHVFGSSGTFTVTAIGTTDTGNSKRATTGITVSPRTPVNVTLTASPNPTMVGKLTNFTVTFDGSTPVNVSRYEWNFGDGSTATTTGRETNHVYQSAATRTARVVVRTTDGNSGTGQTQVVVN